MSIERLERGSAFLFELFYMISKELEPGVLDSTVEHMIMTRCASSGYQSAVAGYRGFSGFCCISRNDVAAHGTATGTPFMNGDLVTFDVALQKDGWYSDAAWTFLVGDGSASAKAVLAAAWRCTMQSALTGLRGRHLGDITRSAHETATTLGYSIPPACYGHGIGQQLHAEPRIPFDVEDPLYPALQLQPIPKDSFLNVEPLVFRPGLGRARRLTLAGTGALTTPEGQASAQFEFTVWTGNRRQEGRILSLPGLNPYDHRIESMPPFF